jgi:hypothetical protein
VEQRTIAHLTTAEIRESVSQVQPLADGAVLVFNDQTGGWDIREQSGVHLVALDAPLFASPFISPDGHHLAQAADGAVVIYDWPERTSRTLDLDVAADADLLWNTEGDQLAVLSRAEGSTRLIMSRIVDGVVLTEHTWAAGEEVYLFEWGIADGVRVIVWTGGGCRVSGPPPRCDPPSTVLMELSEEGTTNISPVPTDNPLYCGIEASPLPCIVMTPAPDDGSVSPDGRYTAAFGNSPQDGFYLRLVSTSDQTFADIPVPDDIELRISWSPDSQFVYLSP